MILGWIRLMVMAFLVLTVVYLAVALYSRSVRREKLEKAWDTDPAREGAPAAEREAFIEAGMRDYHQGLKKRLLWLIYIVPLIVFSGLFYILNFQ
jgi:Ca2+/Na+ antiporter